MLDGQTSGCVERKHSSIRDSINQKQMLQGWRRVALVSEGWAGNVTAQNRTAQPQACASMEAGDRRSFTLKLPSSLSIALQSHASPFTTVADTSRIHLEYIQPIPTLHQSTYHNTHHGQRWPSFLYIHSICPHRRVFNMHHHGRAGVHRQEQQHLQ